MEKKGIELVVPRVSQGARKERERIKTNESIELCDVFLLTLHPRVKKIPRISKKEWISFLNDVRRRGVVVPIEITGALTERQNIQTWPFFSRSSIYYT